MEPKPAKLAGESREHVIRYTTKNSQQAYSASISASQSRIAASEGMR